MSKLFTNFTEILENSILIDVEEYRHKSRTQKNKEVLGEYQYVSAFCDNGLIYPVKVTAEQRKVRTESNVHVTVTIGTLPINDIEKEEHSILRVHPSNYGGESSDSGRYSSFDIILPQLVKYFNENQAILIKNFPDQMLSEEQLVLKQKLINFDKEKDIAKRMELYSKQMYEAIERGENFAYKVVPHEYSEKMRVAMIESGLCFLPYQTEENGDVYLTIAVQAKDADAFIKIQEDVFKSKTLSNKEISSKVSDKPLLVTNNEYDEPDI